MPPPAGERACARQEPKCRRTASRTAIVLTVARTSSRPSAARLAAEELARATRTAEMGACRAARILEGLQATRGSW